MRSLAAALFMLAAPAAAAATPQGHASPEKAPESIWRMDKDGSAEHLQTGLRCPTTIDGYVRVGVPHVYDAYGQDVSCGWNATGVHAALTLYLTRGTDLDGGFAEAQRELLQFQAAQNPKLASDDHFDRGGLHWRKAAYTEYLDVRTDVWMADLHGWMLEYRATYPAAASASVEHALDALTALASASAGPRLATCVKDQPVKRDGRPVKGKDSSDLGLMGALLGGVAQAAAQEHKSDDGPPSAPVTFCLEGGVRGTPMLAWHGVHEDGSDAGIDQLTTVSMGPPLVLETSMDSLGNLIAAEASKGSAVERWTASLEHEGRTYIFGYYDGRPSAATLAPLMRQIIDGKATPLSSYGLNGKDISIGVTPK